MKSSCGLMVGADMFQATHDATIITAVTSLSKAPHSRQRSQSNGSPQTIRQLNGMGPVLPPPFSARIRSMTVSEPLGFKTEVSDQYFIQSVDTESLHQLRAVVSCAVRNR